MAWNRSVEDVRAGKPAEKKRKPVLLKASIAVAAAVCGLAVVLHFGRTEDDAVKRPEDPAGKRPKIVEAKTNAVVKTAPAKTKVKEPEHNLKPGEVRSVQWKRPDNWDQLTRAEKTRIQPVARVALPAGWRERSLFTKPSDLKIERLMSHAPGSLMLGTVRYDKRFVEQFLESLKTPIEFSEEDTEKDKAMKQAVIDVRADLKAAYDRGEDIAEIMNAAEKEAHRLSAYKLNLRKEIVEYRQSGEHSEQDVKDYIAAANKMLSDNGMEPLRLGELWYRKATYDAHVEASHAPAEKK